MKNLNFIIASVLVVGILFYIAQRMKRLENEIRVLAVSMDQLSFQAPDTLPKQTEPVDPPQDDKTPDQEPSTEIVPAPES